MSPPAVNRKCLTATTNGTLLHRLPCEEAEASLHAIFVSPNACSEIPICPFMFVISICSRISSYRSLISSTITLLSSHSFACASQFYHTVVSSSCLSLERFAVKSRRLNCRSQRSTNLAYRECRCMGHPCLPCSLPKRKERDWWWLRHIRIWWSGEPVA